MSNKIKILHITPTDIRYDGRILKEIKSLEKIQNCALLAYGIEDNEGQDYSVEQNKNLKIFKLFTKKIKFLPRPIKYFLNLLEALFRISIPGIVFRPKIIHCHDTLFLPIALIIKFFCNSILIYDAHELESDKAGQSKILSKYTLFIEKTGWKYIDLLICVSPSIIDWYKSNIGEKNSLLILNAPRLETNFIAEKNNYLREKFNIPSDKKIFLYLGIISKVGRGISYFIEAFQRQEIDSHLVLVGYGENVEEIKKIEKTHLNIHYHQAVPYDQVVEISQSADVGLCLIEAISKSTYFSLPNKLFEYAFSNVYILASNFPDMKKIVEQYSLGTCSDLDKEQIFQKIKKLETENTEIKNNNKLHALSWVYQEEKLIEAYGKLLNKK